MVRARKFVYAREFDGVPKLIDFQLVEQDITESIKDGEILCEAEYLSVDPYMRKRMLGQPSGTLMVGAQVAKVLKSKDKNFPEGSHIFGQFGWSTHTITTPSAILERKPYVLPSFGSHPRSLGISYCGPPGNTAYFGLLELCKPKPGETVVVTAAAGAVGSIVGQIAKIKGCRVVGFAGSEEKCKWLTDELGFDAAINYKTADNAKALKEAAPNGVDCYFENVGGELGYMILTQMNLFGRVAVCGTISVYNLAEKDMPKTPIFQPIVLQKQLRIEGFNVFRWEHRWMEGINQLAQWIQEGKLKYNETVTEGFANMPQAFIDIFGGINVGKSIVKA